MSKHTKREWFSKREGWSTVYVECRIGGGMLQARMHFLTVMMLTDDEDDTE